MTHNIENLLDNGTNHQYPKDNYDLESNIGYINDESIFYNSFKEQDDYVGSESKTDDLLHDKYDNGIIRLNLSAPAWLIDEIVENFTKNFERKYDSKYIYEMISKAHFYVLMKGTFQGALVYIMDDVLKYPKLDIKKHVYVSLLSSNAKGAGTKLMRFLEEKTRGPILLTSRPNAIEFYKRLGYINVYKRRFILYPRNYHVTGTVFINSRNDKYVVSDKVNNTYIRNFRHILGKKFETGKNSYIFKNGYLYGCYNTNGEKFTADDNNEIFKIMETEVGVESISTNIDWKFNTTLANVFEELYWTTDVEDALYNIDRVIYERFKIRTKHYASNVMYGCIPIGLKFNSSLVNNYSDLYKNAEHMIEDGVADDIAKVFYNSTNSLEEAITKRGIQIDNENVVIHGLPDDFVVPMLINPSMLIDNKIKPEYIAAIALHEIGHIFSLFNFMTDYNSNDLNEISKLRSRFSKNGKITITADDIYIIKNAKASSIRNHKVEYEYMSDNFATRFGYGEVLVKALKYIDDDFSNSDGMDWFANLSIIRYVKDSRLFGFIMGIFTDEIKEKVKHPDINSRIENIRKELEYMCEVNDDADELTILKKQMEAIS